MKFKRKFLILLTVAIFLPAISFAHVGYVVPEGTIHEKAGSDFDFLLNALRDPLNFFLVLGTFVLISFAYFILRQNTWFLSKTKAVAERAASYYELTPWMLRLSLGIALIGAGVAKVLISPSFAGFPQLSFLQILLGFFLLAGFFLAPAVIVAIILFIFALSQNFYLLGNFDFLVAAIVLLVFANPKPGLDDLFGIPFFLPLKSLQKWAPLILRVGIGGAMMFLAMYEKLLNPNLFAAVVENYHLTSVIPVSPEMWVLSAGLIEIAVGFLLFIGLRTRLVSAIAFLVLSLSFFYFSEDVYSHITLFGVLSVLFVTGGGKLSVDESMQDLSKSPL